MQRPKPTEAATATSPKTVQAPKELIITIISSDGEAFSLTPGTIAHSHLLEGAVRRWAEVYQAKRKERAGTPCTPTGALDDDDDDATVDDLEATPDENYIARFYEETASDVMTTSGALEEAGSGCGAGAAALPLGRGVADDDDDDAEPRRRQTRRHAARATNTLAHEETAHHTSNAAPTFALANVDEETPMARQTSDDAENNLRGADNDDTDSDRTASLLPSSVESSISSTSSPFRSRSSGGTPTRVSDVAGVVTEVAGLPSSTHTPRSDTHTQLSPTLTAAVRHSVAAVSGGAGRSGSIGNTPTGTTRQVSSATAAATNNRTARSPVVAGTSPSSRGSRASVSTLMDADQSTPSVLSGEEGEEEEEQSHHEGASGASGGKPSSRDPRNLGDEERDSVEASSSPSELMSPSGSSMTTTAAVPNGRSAPRHRDPVFSAPPSFAPGAATSSSHFSYSGGGRRKGHQRSGTVVQVGAAEADDDFDDDVKGDAAREEGVGVGLGTAPAVAMTSVGSACGGSGRPRASPPPPDWCSPSSCHQRTPCMADEDDVGAMMAEDVFDAEGGSPPRLGSSRTDSIGGSSPSTKPSLAPGAGGTASASAPSPMDHTLLTPATPATASACVAAVTAVTTKKKSDDEAEVEPLASSLAYADGIRITSSTIVLDLLRTVSPRPSSSSGDTTAAAPVSTSADTAAGAPPTAAAPTVNIRSSTLLMCIKYMEHFAEAEAQAAADAAAAGKRGKHEQHKRQRGRYGNSSSGDDNDDDSSATGTSSTSSSSIASRSSSGKSDEADNDTEELSTVSDSSFSALPTGVLPGDPGAAGGAARGGSLLGAGHGTAPGSRASPPCGPAVIPAPLTTPLVALLSPWERSFLYTDVLGAPETVLTAALAILDACPSFDYGSPNVHLRDAKVRAALMVPPPPPEGVRTLVEVMAAAKQLQIDPLHALCAGWLADFMIRASYGAVDNFEAAHIIRQCLRVTSDWNRRETDCLKIENEWPANEESE
ncbi:hypothetical protein, conserved [Leishmania tarentolae]|uniref:Uncharacterized protein n=1 Tax=Leishmania tarentolae TaxID=5689 RepID=A0A640KF66_LEITA|nr:hypothetical protein, conserved [Leishmania tarentolae]